MCAVAQLQKSDCFIRVVLCKTTLLCLYKTDCSIRVIDCQCVVLYSHVTGISLQLRSL